MAWKKVTGFNSPAINGKSGSGYQYTDPSGQKYQWNTQQVDPTTGPSGEKITSSNASQFGQSPTNFQVSIPDGMAGLKKKATMYGFPSPEALMATSYGKGHFETLTPEEITKYHGEPSVNLVYVPDDPSLIDSPLGGPVNNNPAGIGNQPGGGFLDLPFRIADSGGLAMAPFLAGAAGIFGGGFAGTSVLGAGAETGAAAGEAGWLGGGIAGTPSISAPFNFAAADATGLAQMGQAAGLSGQALQDFVESGGILGSTAAGGGGIGTGVLNTLENLLTPSPTSLATSDASQLAQQGWDAGVPGYDPTGPAPNLDTSAAVPGATSVGTTAATAGTAATRIVDQLMGKSTASTADWTSVLGTLGATGLGMYNADQQRADRAPALAKYNEALNNPDTFYNSAPARGALDAVLRKLSAQTGSPTDPGTLEKAAAYNLGGYNDYLRALSGPAFNAANAKGGALTTLAGGLSDILNPKPQGLTMSDLLKLSVAGSAA